MLKLQNWVFSILQVLRKLGVKDFGSKLFIKPADLFQEGT